MSVPNTWASARLLSRVQYTIDYGWLGSRSDGMMNIELESLSTDIANSRLAGLPSVVRFKINGAHAATIDERC